MDQLDIVASSDLRMLEHLAVPVWVFDLTGHCIWWANPAAVALWKADSLAALKARDFSADSETVHDRLRQLVQEGRTADPVRESWTLYPDGAPIDVTVRCRPVRTGPQDPAILIEALEWQDTATDTRETRLREAVRYAGVMISMFSMSGALLVQNAAAFACYGKGGAQAGDDVLSRRIADNEGAARLIRTLEKAEAFDAELEMETVAGLRIHRVRAHRGLDPATGETAMILSEDDVSDLVALRRNLRDLNTDLERHVAERSKQLHISEQRFSLAMRGANDGLWDWNFETGDIYFSPRWLNMLGLDADGGAPSISTMQSLVHPDDREMVKEVVSKVMSGEHSALEVEFRMRHVEGHWVDILSRAFVVVRDDTVVRMVGTHIDITERKRNLRSLRRLKEILYEGSEALPVGVAYFDTEMKLVMNSSLYTQMLPVSGHLLVRGVSFADLIRNSAERMAPQHGFDNPEDYVTERVRAARAGPRSWEFEQSAGRTIIATEIPTSGSGVISILEDITDEKAALKKLQQSQKMEVIGQLTGGVAHDFNNLLAVIMGNLELLQFEVEAGTTETEGFNALIDAAIEAVKHGADLTNSMLAYARKARLAPALTDLNQTIRQTERWMRRTIESSIEIETVLQGGVWEIRVDRSSLQSALVNLILNARDAMPGGGRLTIETANVRIDESYLESRMETIPPGRYVMVAISDTGTGMAGDVIDRIYDPFFTTKPVGKGTGLGLSMVEGFVRQSGGFVRVYSEPGQGSSFKLYFSALNGEETAPPPVPTSAETRGGDGNRLRVLLAEDRPEVMVVLEKILSNAGFDVTTAVNGDLAYQIFEADPSFDLVLTDVVMPGRMQGPAFAKACRKLRPDTPFIFLSGYASEATVHGNGLSPDDMRLMKPISRKDLLAAVEKRLKQSPGDAE